MLGSDNDQGFRTPLATLHAFNGWADQFLATPADGLEDAYGLIDYRISSWSLQGRYHRFSAEATGRTFGDELDLAARRPLGDRYSLLLKFAAFDADDAAFADARKFWLMVTAKFH